MLCSGCGDPGSGESPVADIGGSRGTSEPDGAAHPDVAHTDVDALDHACQLCVAMLPDARWAGVSVVGAGRPFTAAASDPRVITLQQAQFDLGDGPCLRAVQHHRTISLRVDEIAVRWPGLARTARSAGIGSTHSVPLHAGDAVVGSLNLYGSYPGYGLAVPAAVLTMLTSYLERVLGEYSAGQNGQLSASRLRRAIDRREVVEQARGVLMATSGLDRRDAGIRLQELADQRRCTLVAAARSTLRQHHQANPGRTHIARTGKDLAPGTS